MLDANTMLDMVQETLLQSPVDIGLTILTLLIFSMVFSVRKIVLGFLRRKHKKNPAHRQWVRTSRYLGLGVSLLLTIPLWIDTLENIGVFVGLLTAALAVSLSSPLQSIAGWVHLIVHQPYRVGDRETIIRHGDSSFLHKLPYEGTTQSHVLFCVDKLSAQFAFDCLPLGRATAGN